MEVAMRGGYFLKALTFMLWIAATVSFANAVEKNSATDTQIKKAIIKQSIEEYPGNCPCPYNTASNGSRCGRRSAYSRPGGYAPICYENDVTSGMIREWGQNHNRP
jgi:hypothetical protein